MTDEETAAVNVQVPERTKELAKDKLEHGGITRVVTEALANVAHGAKTTEMERVKDSLRDLRDERQGLQNERNKIDDQLDDIERKIERAEERLESLRDKEGEYEGALSAIEAEMRDEDISVFPSHGRVTSAAEVGGCDPEKVIADLKERNPELPDERFQPLV